MTEGCSYRAILGKMMRKILAKGTSHKKKEGEIYSGHKNKSRELVK